MDCGIPKIKLGVAMTPEVMHKMKADERRFWEKFLSRAQKEIGKASDGTIGDNEDRYLNKYFKNAKLTLWSVRRKTI